MTDNVYTALFKLQGVLRGVKRDAKNPHFRNSYATLEQVTDTIRPHMQACGLLWIQSPGKIIEGNLEVHTEIVHPETGTSHAFVMEMPLAKRDPQGAGSAMTYAMRYSLMAALGLPPTDDDAETAIDRNNTRPDPNAKPKDAPSVAETIARIEELHAENQKAKSSAELKRADEWNKLQNDLAQDMVDCRTLVALEQVKKIYRKRAVMQGWPPAWTAALKNEFDTYEERIKADGEIVKEIEDTFPGAHIIDIRNSPLNAG